MDGCKRRRANTSQPQTPKVKREPFATGGSSTIASLLPTKTLAIGGDTRPDQSGVPATFHCDGKGLSQVPQHHHYFHVYTVAAYSILFDDDQDMVITQKNFHYSQDTSLINLLPI